MVIIALLVLCACGRAGVSQGPGSTASPTRTASPSPVASPSPSSSPWPVYADSRYQFSISYPLGFTFQPQHGIEGTPIVMEYRAVDPRYLSGYPPGEIDLGIYAKDANTLVGWVTRHSGPSSSPDPNRLWSPVTNEATSTVAGHDAFSFDWVPDTGSSTLHTTAVFLGATYVLLVMWWSNDVSYAPTLQQYYQQMLTDLKE
jgi:hypothetical protein